MLRKVLTTVAATSVALIIAAPAASASTIHKWGPVKKAGLGVSAKGTWTKVRFKGKYYTHIRGTVYDTANDKKSAYLKYSIRYYSGIFEGIDNTDTVKAPGGKGKNKSFDLWESAVYGRFDSVKVKVCVDSATHWEKCTGWKTIYKR